MNKNDIRLLEKAGWSVDCESPFEISMEDGSFASGEGALIVLQFLQEEVCQESSPLTDEMKDEILDYVLPEGSFSKGVFEDCSLTGTAYAEGTVNRQHVADFLFNCRELLGEALERLEI